MSQPTKSKHESGAVAREEDLSPILPDGSRRRILTGDRTTGKLHLGHYIGSLKNRVRLQESYDTFILLADVQALTTHYDRPEMIKPSVMDVALDYLAVGIDPQKSTIVVQSMVPSIAELTVFYGLLVPMASLLDNPTTKAEAEQLGIGKDDKSIPAVLKHPAYADLVAHVKSYYEERFSEIGDLPIHAYYDALTNYWKERYEFTAIPGPDGQPLDPSELDNHLLMDRFPVSIEMNPFEILNDVILLPHRIRDFRAYLMRSKRTTGLRQLSYGFLGYPVSQAADITFVGGHLVPVGPDQVPLIELCREVVHRFNAQYGQKDSEGNIIDPILVEPQALLGTTELLRGLDGSIKMGKSLGNAVYLSDSTEQVWNQLRGAVTDPQRIRKTDPGRPEVCNIFSWHKTFCGAHEPVINEAELGVASVDEVAENCRGAKWGCIDCKKNLHAKLEALLGPIRERRAYWEQRPDEVIDILKLGTRRANEEGQKTLARVKAAMHIDHFAL
ncbi:tryptophan--tRNA ligase [bacterium]|nr:tryptophan--tRNA ligase [bacterium]